MSSLFKAFNFGKSKHKKLPEVWQESEPVNDGMTFYVKYLGSTLVDEPSSESCTADGIKAIISMAKISGKKLVRVSLTVKPTGIVTQDVITGEKHLDVSIYRISYCSADATFDRVVAFIATNKNETLECHAFLTNKRKAAQAAALTISQAFTIAFERWNKSKTNKPFTTFSSSQDDNCNGKNKPTIQAPVKEPTLIDLSVEVDDFNKEEFRYDKDFDGSFARLAELRSSNSFKKSDLLLPTNLDINNMDDLNKYFSLQDNVKDEFFSDDSPDDLLSL